MIRNTLNCSVNTMIKCTNNCCPSKNPHICKTTQLVSNISCPFTAWFVIQDIILCIKAASSYKVLINNNNSDTRSRSSKCRGQASRTSSDNQNICMEKTFVITIWVWLQRRRAQTCSSSNYWFIYLFPKNRWPHKCFIIKSCGQKRR